MTRTAVPVFGACINGPTGDPNATNPVDGTTIAADAGHQFCFDPRPVPALGTSNLFISDQRIPAPCPASSQCLSNETGFLQRATIVYNENPLGHEGQMFSFAFVDDLSKKYYQTFDKTLVDRLSGYVFPRDTLF